MPRFIRNHMAVAFVFLTALLFSGIAFAAQAVDPSATPATLAGAAAKIAIWYPTISLVLMGIEKVCDPSFPFPINIGLTMKSKALLIVICGVVLSALQSITTGTPILQAALVGAMAIATAIAHAKPAAAASSASKIAGAALIVMTIGMFAGPSTGCAKGVNAKSAALGLLSTVLADVNAHDSLPQLEADVATDIGQDVNSPLVTEVLDYVLDVLEATQQISSSVAAEEASMHSQVRVKVAAAKASSK